MPFNKQAFEELKKVADINATVDDLVSRSELMGSRGRARMYGRPEPEGRDHDYVIFTDDPDEHSNLNTSLRSLESSGFSMKERPGGFLTAHSPAMDISYYPTSKKQDILQAWSLIESGMSKDDAWKQVEASKVKAANLYHGSSSKYDELQPGPSRVLGDESAVFATPNRDIALTFLNRWRDDDFYLGSTDGGPYVFRENYPGAFEKIFKGKKGFLHSLAADGFNHDPRLTKFERIAKQPVKPTNVEQIDDALEALRGSGLVMENYKSANHKLVHYSIDKHDVLRPLSYEELTKDRARGSWKGRDDLAKQYVAKRKWFESELHRRLISRGLPTDRNNSFLYATIDGHEQFGSPGYYRHEMPLTDDVINTSFFDVVGDNKNRTTIGRRGLANALNRWAEAQKNNGLNTSEYMGMAIRPRIEVITPTSLTPANVTKTSSDRVRVVMPYEDGYLMETMHNPKWPQNLGKRRFVGGGIDNGETPEQAASRELMEELGIQAAVEKFKYLGLDPRETSHKLHYLQLDDHGLKPGQYKATVGSDPFIHLNKGLPSGDDYTGADLMSLLKGPQQ